MKPLIQITRRGLKFSGSKKDIHGLRGEFNRRHCLKFRNFLETELMREIAQGIQTARFHTMVHKGIGVEACMGVNKAYLLLLFLTNDAKFFDLMQEITECGEIGCFNARVYRMVPGKGHYDSWHDDAQKKDRRFIAMSINLSEQIYKGGLLQIRQKGAGTAGEKIANTGFGDAIIFRIHPRFEHRVTTLKGNQPKTALAGWFQEIPDFNLLLKKKGRGRLSLRRGSHQPMRILEGSVYPAKDAVFIHRGMHTDLMNLKNGYYYRLNAVGGRIWDLMRQRRSLRSVVQTLSEEYDADSKQIEKDTLRLMRHLHNNGLVESGTNGDSPL